MSSSLNKSLNLKPNPDIVKERENAECDMKKLGEFFGKILFGSQERHKFMMDLRSRLVKEIEPINYNFYNLDREDRFDFTFRKSIALLEFADKNNITNGLERSYIIGPVLGTEKHLFTLHTSMVRNSIELWGDEEQREYWIPKLKDYSAMFTYAQTELGHGTYVRGLETTATFDEKTDEFVLNSPTISSYKFWPGSLGVTSNHAIVMAKLVIKNKDHGIQAFLVPLRSTVDHKPLKNIEIGDIGMKYGFNSQDNGYLAFHSYRIPRNYMLMNFSKVSRDGTFTNTGNEKLMYASMLLMRATLSMYAASLLSGPITIAIRYSCVRHQTPNNLGIEPPILDYQTQQYRLFSGLSTCYAIYFTALYFRDSLNVILKETNNLRDISSKLLAKLHAISSATKAYGFDQCLKFAQICRLCCGGHGYSASSGLSQFLVEADAGCTYEGDNIVLYLQTARYLLKCAQRNESPHFEVKNQEKFMREACYKNYENIIEKYYQLFDRVISEIGQGILLLVQDGKKSEYEAWNESTVALVEAAKLYTNIYVILSNVSIVYTYYVEYGNDSNYKTFLNLFEIYLLYGLSDIYGDQFLKHEVITPTESKEYKLRLLSLLPEIRKNAVLLVDAFDLPDSSLCSTLGSYDGNAYERLLDFARNSKMNKKDTIDQFEKYLKPFLQRQKNQSKL